ncbi:MAG TPA: HIT domain-containing protein [Candidatus Babeliales bacterium]|nr:HIT domain-containing protein [Candidatus Babeliales bacterium]HLC07483.1 HIT domain-containing protein [Candidatus Babeliales bacterium]
MDNNCVFCKIIAGQLPSKVIAETKDIIVIDNIAPKTPIHYLIIPKKHIADINSLKQDDVILVGEMVMMAKKLSEDLSGSQDFRLSVNNGLDAGQSVFHLHIHFLAGQKFFDHV